MTDKQIIIDASQCEWRTGIEHCGDYECMLNKCCDYNCDWYKRRKLEQQLKRKEQECEGLKKTVDDLLHKPEIQDKILWKIDNEALLGSKDAYIYKLEKTLTEIKEIAKNGCYDDCGMPLDELSIILQKISEVEDENI